MHELSVACDLVEMVSEEAARRGIDHIVTVHLRLGALSGVAREALLFSFDVAAKGTILEGVRLSIEDVPLAVYCPACRAERTIAGPPELRCPVCGASAPHIVRGRELELIGLEVPDEDADH